MGVFGPQPAFQGAFNVARCYQHPVVRVRVALKIDLVQKKVRSALYQGPHVVWLECLIFLACGLKVQELPSDDTGVATCGAV